MLDCWGLNGFNLFSICASPKSLQLCSFLAFLFLILSYNYNVWSAISTDIHIFNTIVYGSILYEVNKYGFITFLVREGIMHK